MAVVETDSEHASTKRLEHLAFDFDFLLGDKALLQARLTRADDEVGRVRESDRLDVDRLGAFLAFARLVLDTSVLGQ